MTEQSWMTYLRTLPPRQAREKYESEMYRRTHFYPHHHLAVKIALMIAVVVIFAASLGVFAYYDV